MPEGPNEDIAQCPEPGCWGYTFALRPVGETFGEHRADCALPLRHLSYCQPGGAGHPPSQVVRGFWPQQYLVPYEITDSRLPLTVPALVTGFLNIAAETPEHAQDLALIKAKKDHANDMFDGATVHVGDAQLIDK
jgi:hypothetical protein